MTAFHNILHEENAGESFIESLLTAQCSVKQRLATSQQNYILQNMSWTEINLGRG